MAPFCCKLALGGSVARLCISCMGGSGLFGCFCNFCGGSSVILGEVGVGLL